MARIMRTLDLATGLITETEIFEEVNMLSIEEVPDPVLEAKPDVQALADALAQLPPDTLNALKQALGL